MTRWFKCCGCRWAPSRLCRSGNSPERPHYFYCPQLKKKRHNHPNYPKANIIPEEMSCKRRRSIPPGFCRMQMLSQTQDCEFKGVVIIGIWFPPPLSHKKCFQSLFRFHRDWKMCQKRHLEVSFERNEERLSVPGNLAFLFVKKPKRNRPFSFQTAASILTVTH